ncbi:MAG: nucleotidyl transferase AbiEii/AbiGii toxin family protein [Candidatus Micrarchaeota archaeon]
MIEKKELMEIARIKGLKPWQQEKHYLQAVILEVLAEQPLVFKGGTYLWFFHSLPRFSEDLDFTAKEIMPKNLAETVSKSLELFGIQNTNKIISNNKTTLSFRISAKGPLNTKQIDECRVYVEISKREKIEEKILPIKLDFPEYNLSTKRASGMNLNEIAAEKIRAILTRKKARDLYDLHYLIEKKQVSFNQKLADKKLAFCNKKFSKKEFLDKAKEKKDYFEKELKNIVFDELPEFNQTIKKIKNWIK